MSLAHASAGHPAFHALVSTLIQIHSEPIGVNRIMAPLPGWRRLMRLNRSVRLRNLALDPC